MVSNLLHKGNPFARNGRERCYKNHPPCNKKNLTHVINIVSARNCTIALLCLLAGPALLAVSPSPARGTAQAPADTTAQKRPRYSVRKTTAQDTKDLEHKTADLRDPDNLKTEVTYDEQSNTYSVGTSLDLTAGGRGGGKGTSTQTGTRAGA